MLLHKKLLETIAEEKKHTFISTGMSTMKQIENAIKIFKQYKLQILPLLVLPQVDPEMQL